MKEIGFLIEGEATKTVIKKALAMLKKGTEKEYTWNSGLNSISIYTEQDGTRFAVINTTKIIKTGKDRYINIAGDNAVIKIIGGGIK